MTRSDEQGNGNKETGQGTFMTAVLEDNPYLQRNSETVRDKSVDDDEMVSEEYGAPVEPENKHRKIKRRRQRLALVGIATLFVFAIVVAVTVYRRSPTRVNYGRTRQSGVLPPVPSPNTTTGRDARTDKAIEDAQRLTDTQRSSSTNATASPVPDPSAKSGTVLDNPFKTPVDSNNKLEIRTGTNGQGIVAETMPTTENNQAQPFPNSSSTIRSQRNSETSLYMSEPGPERVTTGTANPKAPTAFKPVTKSLDVTLPAFASMLPVRTIGALYTLRSGALVRFELTRDTKGDGWLMKRGTILVGTTKGGDVDRAYVSLLGFIDPEMGKLVKLGGDLLGGDGGAGLKGKRRRINGGWTRAFAGVASVALDVTGAVLSGRADDTVIISDGTRSRVINPVTDQINGVLTNELQGRQGQSFVEVIAGTPGYVLVTDLPSTIKGTEPTSELNNDTLASLSDVDTTRSATGLTEREFADLLADGSPEEIRSALPRMSPQMRKVAEAVLRP